MSELLQLSSSDEEEQHLYSDLPPGLQLLHVDILLDVCLEDFAILVPIQISWL